MAVYQRAFNFEFYQVNNVHATIDTSNNGSPATNLCWDGSTITSEDALTAAVNTNTIDILIAFSTGDQAVWSESTKNFISTALADGKLQKLLLFDRYASEGNVTGDVQFPGLAAGSVVYGLAEPSTPINALSSPNVGPAGTVGSWSGCNSNHGYIKPVTPLPEAEYHFQRQPDSNAVSAQFCHNQKLVYYSTTPNPYLWGNVDTDVKPNPKKKPLVPGVYEVSDLSDRNEIAFTQNCTGSGA